MCLFLRCHTSPITALNVQRRIKVFFFRTETQRCTCQFQDQRASRPPWPLAPWWAWPPPWRAPATWWGPQLMWRRWEAGCIALLMSSVARAKFCGKSCRLITIVSKPINFFCRYCCHYCWHYCCFCLYCCCPKKPTFEIWSKSGQ